MDLEKVIAFRVVVKRTALHVSNPEEALMVAPAGAVFDSEYCT